MTSRRTTPLAALLRALLVVAALGLGWAAPAAATPGAAVARPGPAAAASGSVAPVARPARTPAARNAAPRSASARSVHPSGKQGAAAVGGAPAAGRTAASTVPLLLALLASPAALAGLRSHPVRAPGARRTRPGRRPAGIRLRAPPVSGLVPVL